MKKEKFCFMLQAIDTKDREIFDNAINDVGSSGENYYTDEAELFLAYAAEIGALEVVEDILEFDKIPVSSNSFYALRIAKAKGFNDIVDILNQNVTVDYESLDRAENFETRIRDFKEYYTERLAELFSKANKLFAESLEGFV